MNKLHRFYAGFSRCSISVAPSTPAMACPSCPLRSSCPLCVASAIATAARPWVMNCRTTSLMLDPRASASASRARRCSVVTAIVSGLTLRPRGFGPRRAFGGLRPSRNENIDHTSSQETNSGRVRHRSIRFTNDYTPSPRRGGKERRKRLAMHRGRSTGTVAVYHSLFQLQERFFIRIRSQYIVCSLIFH